MTTRIDGIDGVGVYLFWIPLGAGGTGFVRLNGRIYETFRAILEGRRRLDLYHTALVVSLPDSRYVVETMWPIPDLDGRSRGAVVVGPVFSRRLSSSRLFRYEVRCWIDGALPDASEAVGGPRLVSAELDVGHRLLGLAPRVPIHTWGRDPFGIGDMWNSNSVVSWLLASAGVDMAEVSPPAGGRAPGWSCGLTATHNTLVAVG